MGAHIGSQSVRNAAGTGEEGYRFVIHDRDCIYSGGLDQSLESLGLTVLKTPSKMAAGECIFRAVSAVHAESV